jgi:isopentenyl-diphosphate Delta-isomerase
MNDTFYQPSQVSEELLPIVNESDEVIGTEKRGVIHAQRMLHRAVHILLFNATGSIYLQRRSLSKDAAPGKWDSSASGHVDPGESYERAAERELAEELNLHSRPTLQPVAKLPASRQTGMEFTMIYQALSDEEPQPNPHEIMEGKWLLPAEVDAWMEEHPKAFAGCFRLVWQTWRSIQPGLQ